jgi:hypothetical protein
LRLILKDRAFGVDVFVHAGVPVQVVRRDVGDQRNVTRALDAMPVLKLKAAQLKHHDVFRADFADAVQQRLPAVAAQPHLAGLRLYAGHASCGAARRGLVGPFAFEFRLRAFKHLAQHLVAQQRAGGLAVAAGDADGAPTASFDEQAHLHRDFRAGIARELQVLVVGAHGWAMDHDLGVAEVFFAVLTQAVLQRQPRKLRQAVAQHRFVTKVGYDDAFAKACQEFRAFGAAAEHPQPHHQATFAAKALERLCVRGHSVVSSSPGLGTITVVRALSRYASAANINCSMSAGSALRRVSRISCESTMIHGVSTSAKKSSGGYSYHGVSS